MFLWPRLYPRLHPRPLHLRPSARPPARTHTPLGTCRSRLAFLHFHENYSTAHGAFEARAAGRRTDWIGPDQLAADCSWLGGGQGWPWEVLGRAGATDDGRSQWPVGKPLLLTSQIKHARCEPVSPFLFSSRSSTQLVLRSYHERPSYPSSASPLSLPTSPAPRSPWRPPYPCPNRPSPLPPRSIGTTSSPKRPSASSLPQFGAALPSSTRPGSSRCSQASPTRPRSRSTASRSPSSRSTRRRARARSSHLMGSF